MRNYLKWTSALAVLAGLVVATPAQAAPTCGPATVSVDSTDAYEGTAQQFRVTATPSSPGCAVNGQVNYETKAGSATPGSDFTGVAGTLAWQAGSPLSRTITVAVTADSSAEADEYFTLRLTNPRTLQVETEVGTGTIIDDDGKERPALVLTPMGGGICWQPNDVCAIPLKLSTVALAPFSVNWATADLDAVAGVDYVGVKKAKVVFEEGSDTGYAVVDLLPGGSGSSVSFLAQFGQPTAGAISDAKVVVTIGWQ